MCPRDLPKHWLGAVSEWLHGVFEWFFSPEYLKCQSLDLWAIQRWQPSSVQVHDWHCGSCCSYCDHMKRCCVLRFWHRRHLHVGLHDTRKTADAGSVLNVVMPMCLVINTQILNNATLMPFCFCFAASVEATEWVDCADNSVPLQQHWEKPTSRQLIYWQ